MKPRNHLAETLAELRSTERLLHEGWTFASLRRERIAGRLFRVSHGVYTRLDTWNSWVPERQLLARVLALAPRQGPNAVWSGTSAAVLHGLPLYRPHDPRAEIILVGARSAENSALVRRSRARIHSFEITEVEGIRVTTLDRTVTDLARLHRPELALAAADAALRALIPAASYSAAESGPHAHECRDRWLARLSDSTDRRGVDRAAKLLRITDCGAESVAESVSRYRLITLGYDVRTQIRVAAPGGGDYRVDFELLDVGVLGEVDGRQKYTNPDLRDGRSADEALYDEKRREDWIRGRTAKRLIRWSPSDTVSLPTFERRLRAFGVSPPPLRLRQRFSFCGGSGGRAGSV
ncbi:hypothetical protein [Leucobacter iarius]|uniref:CTP synthase n=1 Tax=Leucobacter iarius TaxID=333963 RepID=A0ABP4XNC8_9MICO